MNLLVVSLLSGNTEINQPHALIMLFLQAFESIWSVGLIVFGFHLMIVGYVTFKSESIPRIISILVVFASAGYIIIHSLTLLLSQNDTVLSILNILFTVPMIAGELGLGIWLLVKGGKVLKTLPST